MSLQSNWAPGEKYKQKLKNWNSYNTIKNKNRKLKSSQLQLYENKKSRSTNFHGTENES